EGGGALWAPTTTTAAAPPRTQPEASPSEWRALIEEFGPNGFSVAETARRANVSSAAPYKHFSDKNELLNAVVSDAMDRLRGEMLLRRDAHPPGSLEGITALGLAYVNFAKAEPSVFRLMFGVTEGHEDDQALRAKGEATFGIVIETAAECIGVEADDPRAIRTAYLLWTVVHGHSFLSIDDKRKTSGDELSDRDLLLAAGRGLLFAP
ncbi:MAG: TetR/AcrR family transcriptional regulator, partial [Pseudomonadota bacterium]